MSLWQALVSDIIITMAHACQSTCPYCPAIAAMPRGETLPNKQIPFLKGMGGNEETSPCRSTPPSPHYHHNSPGEVSISHSHQWYCQRWSQEGSLYFHWPRPSDESTLEGFVRLERFRQTQAKTDEETDRHRGERKLDKLSHTHTDTQYPNWSFLSPMLQMPP